MNYKSIQEHYELCLKEHNGNKAKEVDWESEKKMSARYSAFIDSISFFLYKEHKILDFGCGTASLFSRLPKSYRSMYTGMDISQNMIEEAKKRYPEGKFVCQDILKTPLEGSWDHVIINGVFTIKNDLHWTEMYDFVSKILTELWDHTNISLSVNFMDENKIAAEDRFNYLFFLSYDAAMRMFIKPLNPKGWTINSSFGTNDYILRILK